MDYMPQHENPSSSSNQSLLTNIVGFSFIASLLQGFLTGRPMTGGGADTSYLANTVQLFFLGTIIESGRRFYQWLVQRFQIQYSITAEFTEGDPTYEWIIHLLTERQVWKRSRDFRVSATNSARKWTASLQAAVNDSIPLTANDSESSEPSQSPANAEYVPTYEAPQIFRWNGYWVEIKRSKGNLTFTPGIGNQSLATLYITIYTRDMTALPRLVDSAKELYLSSSRPHVIIHSTTQNSMPHFSWNNTKRKARRPLDSIILPKGRMDELISDTKEFMNMESWYVKAGIPHRRGYLLYGPPGTGKTSTIYGLAGELGLEIYSISLASSMVDDSFLQRAADSIPKQSIFLIEDIDCAFPAPRDADDDEDDDPSTTHPQMMMGYPMMGRRGRYGMMGGMGRSAVTLSGLLNVLDGVGSEEGKLFFATTNHIDHLDAALLRPGRIDVKIPYKLATQDQAAALFLRFYPEAHTDIAEETLKEFAEKYLSSPPAYSSTEKSEKSTPPGPAQLSLKSQYLTHLSTLFSSHIPADEFSTAELQGFLLSCKSQSQSSLAHSSILSTSSTPLPVTVASPALQVIHKAPIWVETERAYRREKEDREAKKKEKARRKKERVEEEKLRGGLARLVGGMAGGPTSPVQGSGYGYGGWPGPVTGTTTGEAVEARGADAVPPPPKAVDDGGVKLNGVHGTGEGERAKPAPLNGLNGSVGPGFVGGPVPGPYVGVMTPPPTVSFMAQPEPLRPAPGPIVNPSKD